MPQIPYAPVPTVAPSTQATQEVSVQTPIAAFGGTIASAIESGGKAVAHAGDEIFQRAIALQQLENETMAKESDAQYMVRVGELHAKFNSLEGQNAVQAYPRYIREVQMLRQDHRKALPNEMAKKLFDGPSLQLMSRTIFNGAAHAGVENKRWASGAAEARIAGAINWALTNADDNEGFQGAEATVRAEARALANLHGWSKEKLDEQEARFISTLYAQRAISLSRTKPNEAQQFLDANREKIHSHDYDRVETTVKGQMYNAGARNISAQINSDLFEGPVSGRPEKPLETRVREGMAIAREQRPDDPVYAQQVEARIRADYNAHKASVADLEQRDQQTVQGALLGHFGDGRRPHTLDELLNSGRQVEEAYERMPNNRKRAVLSALAQNAKGDYLDTPDARGRRQELWGMAATAPEQFVGVDIANESIPAAWKDQLYREQLRLYKRGEQDPRIASALQQLAVPLNAAGIRKGANNREYLTFVGALAEGMRHYQEVYNKPMPPEEIRKLGGYLLQTAPGSRGVFNWGGDYRFQVPDSEIDTVLKDPRWQNSPPSRDEVRVLILQKRYKEFYPGERQVPPIPGAAR